MSKRLYIETVGCQMNLLDSELVVASLRREGYALVDSPAAADTILFNTCSVRQHAEDKIYSALGRLKQLKRSAQGKSAVYWDIFDPKIRVDRARSNNSLT